MANNERLTKRLKKIEEWVADNEEMGGPRGYLDTMVSMYNNNVNLTTNLQNLQRNFEQMRSFTFEFINEQNLDDEWNEFLKDKENAVQEQQTEKVSVQEEAESGEETIEAPKEESSEKKN